MAFQKNKKMVLILGLGLVVFMLFPQSSVSEDALTDIQVTQLRKKIMQRNKSYLEHLEKEVGHYERKILALERVREKRAAAVKLRELNRKNFIQQRESLKPKFSEVTNYKKFTEQRELREKKRELARDEFQKIKSALKNEFKKYNLIDEHNVYGLSTNEVPTKPSESP